MSGSGPNGEGLPLTPRKVPENPDARPVVTVELPHLLVTDELVERARKAFDNRRALPHRERLRDALSAAAPELWQAGYDASQKLSRGELTCPNCARHTVGQRYDGKLGCPFCGWMS